MLRAGDEARDLHRPGHRPVLRHEFADHHLHGGREQHADHDGHAGHRALGQAGAGERAVQQLGQGRFGQHADDQGGDGDAELGAGELERQFAQGRDDAVGAPVAGRGGLLGVRPLDGDEAELGGHEESVGQDQQERGCEKQQGVLMLPPPPHARPPGGERHVGRGRRRYCRTIRPSPERVTPRIAGAPRRTGRGGRGGGAVGAPPPHRLIKTEAVAAGPFSTARRCRALPGQSRGASASGAECASERARSARASATARCRAMPGWMPSAGRLVPSLRSRKTQGSPERRFT